ncbi:MAG TPA: 30S ribosomal protein S17 [Vicinamibacteria bacterium]|nr:30S ribosomal protein S17 [Vicinamibacteria bacterium]
MARNRENETSTRPRKKTDTGADAVPVKQTAAETGTGTGTGHRNTQVGIVVKAKMTKTVVVAVERLVQHAMYRKTIKRTSTFMAHDEKRAKQGDRVRIVETRPLSRNKRWRVEEILTRGLAEDVAGVQV